MAGRTQAWLAERIGVAASSINGYLKGTVPQADVCMRMCDVLAVDMRWYLTGESSEAGEKRSDDVVQVVFLDQPDRALTYPASHVDFFEVPYESLCCVVVGGNLMSPGIPRGAEVLGTRAFGDVEDGRVYIVKVGRRHSVRRIRIAGDGRFLAVCDNPAASEEVDEFHPDDIVALALWAGHAL